MENTLQVFSEYKHYAIIVHVFSVILGMGAALVSDVLFNVYIKDKKINPTENKTLGVLSRIIWISLGCIVFTGLFIFLSDPIKYAQSVKFLVKMTIVGVIILNGYLFWKITHKSLAKLTFVDTNMNHKYVRIRKVSFAFGAISITSWMSAFILGSVQSIPMSYGVAMGIYGAFILIAVVVSQVVEYIITHR